MHRRSRPTSSASQDKRWSIVIPPNSALIFAVLWDPKGDIVAFSGADLLDGLDDHVKAPDSPTDVCDTYSQTFTIDRSSMPLSEHTATLAFCRDHHEFLFSNRTPILDRFKVGRTQTSSTLEGLDVYLRGSMIGKMHTLPCRFSFLRELGDEIKLQPRTSFAAVWENQRPINGDEPCSDGLPQNTSSIEVNAQVNLSSAFSVTTTSTSRYISVELDEEDDEDSTSWSTIEAPNTPGFSRLLFSEQQYPRNRRLRKRRPRVDTPAPPSEVLQRPCYNHTILSPPNSSCMSKHAILRRCVQGLSLKRWRLKSEAPMCTCEDPSGD